MNYRLSGKRTPEGVEITCDTGDCGFSIKLACKDFAPACQDRAVWNIDGTLVEMRVEPVGTEEILVQIEDSDQPERTAIEIRRPKLAQEAAGWIVEDIHLADQREHTSGWLCILRPPMGVSDSPRVVGGARHGRIYIFIEVLSWTGDPAVLGWVSETLGTVTMSNSPVEGAGGAACSGGTPSQGVSLYGVIRLRQALEGRDFRALLNSEFASPTDQRVYLAVLVSPDSIIELVKQMLADLCDGRYAPQMLVFDGQSCHSIEVISYDPVCGEICYSDPWPLDRGSFLEEHHNAAGVKARSHHTERGHWLLSLSDLKKVIYAVIVPESEVFELVGRLGESPNRQSTSGMLNYPLREALQKDLFTFFGLIEVGRKRVDDEYERIFFHPGAARFQSLVQLEVEVTTDERLRRIALTLSRGFVLDSTNFMFAADMAGNFVLQAGVKSDDPQMLRFIMELEKCLFVDLKSPRSLRNAPSIYLPHIPSRPLLSYLGAIPHCEMDLKSAKFSIDNMTTEGDENSVILQFEVPVHEESGELQDG